MKHIEMKNRDASASNDKGLFALCMFIGLLGFLITWRNDADDSGVKGFFAGFFIPFVFYVLVGLISKKQLKPSEEIIHTTQVKNDEVIIKETNKGRSVEINIIIPKSVLNQ